MERKGKQAHEHSQEKQKYTQDFRYLNLPQQTICPSSTAALFNHKKSVQSLSFLLSEIDFTLDN
jgi:hypothetical protein